MSSRTFFFPNHTFNLSSTFPSNFIKTSKYTLLSFFPLSILLQFRRYANLYFLLTAILQTIPILSPLSPITAWAPLIFVLFLSLLREGIEDFARHKSDVQTNASLSKVYSGGGSMKTLSVLPTNEKQTKGYKADIQMETKKVCSGDMKIDEENRRLDGADEGREVKGLGRPPDLRNIKIFGGGKGGKRGDEAEIDFSFCKQEESKENYNLQKQNSKSREKPGIQTKKENPPKQPDYGELGGFCKKSWADLKVGDVVLVEEMDVFPADMILIATDKDSGLCYIETSSLDGEKNLKAKLAPKETNDKFLSSSRIFRLEGTINCQPPHPDLYSFDGRLNIKGKNISLGEKQLLLRGAVLKNSKWVLGIVVYTGCESKIMLNANPAKSKQSQIETRTNNLILFVLFFELFCCLVSGLGGGYWVARNDTTIGQLYGEENNGVKIGVLAFFSYFLLNNTMIPISLIVSLEFVKMAQAWLMEKDVDLSEGEEGETKSKDGEVKRARVFTSSINEELGQVEYIFTDKTGTLTSNKMEFKLALIGSKLFGDKRILTVTPSNPLPIKRPTYIDKKEGILFSFEDKNLEALLKPRELGKTDISSSRSETFKKPLLEEEGEEEDSKFFNEEEINYRLAKDFTLKNMRDLAVEYFKLLSTCHECLLDSQTNNSMLRYQGPSPDEIALVDTARHMGFTFLERTTKELKVEWQGEIKSVELLKMFPFNSDRKRMSVLIRDSGILKLYTKGADNVMRARLSEEGGKFWEVSEKKLGEFSRKGLRTLVLAMRIVGEEDWARWKRRDEEGEDSQRKEELERLAEEMERELCIIGVTAVEDKLQDQVPETIADFLKANIKVWMLTGDKMETAENIARSCNLIQETSNILRLPFTPSSSSSSSLLSLLNSLMEVAVPPSSSLDRSSSSAMLSSFRTMNKSKLDKIDSPWEPSCLLLDGGVLMEISKSEQAMWMLMEIAKNCSAVVCCRMIPKQKAEIVKMVKENLNKLTLAIGDGANDVNMIQEAHIGVGLYGQEGMRAVQASDYALPQFKCLWKLLLVHGKWSYIRISEMILYFFYKNMVFTICQFYFSFQCGFSAQPVFDEYYIMFYNLIFTCLPLVVRAILEQDVYYKKPIFLGEEGGGKKEEEVGRKEEEEQEGRSSLGGFKMTEKKVLKKYYPMLYYIGQQNTIFTYKNFFLWVWQGILHGCFIFFFCVFLYSNEIITIQGQVADFWMFSITIYTTVILVVNIKLAVYTQYWTLLTVISLFVTSYGCYFGYIWITDQVEAFLSYGTAEMLFTAGSFYLSVFGCMGVVFGLDLLSLFFKAEMGREWKDRVKMGVKMGFERSETFFKKVFEKDEDEEEEGGGREEERGGRRKEKGGKEEGGDKGGKKEKMKMEEIEILGLKN